MGHLTKEEIGELTESIGQSVGELMGNAGGEWTIGDGKVVSSVEAVGDRILVTIQTENGPVRVVARVEATEK